MTGPVNGQLIDAAALELYFFGPLRRANGIVLATDSSAYPPSPYEGQYVDDATLNALLRWDGSAWQTYGPAGDTGWLTLPLGSAHVAYSAGYTPQYRVKGDEVLVRGAIKRGDGNSYSSGVPYTIIAAGGLPTIARPTGQNANSTVSSAEATDGRVTFGADGSMVLNVGPTAMTSFFLGKSNGYTVD